MISDGKPHGSPLTVAASVPNFGDWWTRACSMAPDGRLLVIAPLPVSHTVEITVIVNWIAELKRLSAVR